MSEIFKDKNLSKRVFSVLGHDPNDELGYTESDLQKLDDFNVFRPDARGPWTPKKQPPAILNTLQKLESIQADLNSLHDSLREMGLRNWAGAVREVSKLYDPLVEAFKRKTQS